MEFHGFARRNAKYLWVLFYASVALTLLSVPPEILLPFLKKNPTLVLLCLSAVIAFISYKNQRHLTCAKNTIDFQTAFHNSKELNKATTVFADRICHMTSDEVRQLAHVKDRDDKVNKSARELLNSWERVAVAVKNDVYDEEMLFNTYASFLLTIWQTLGPYIAEKQKVNPKWYVEFQWLALRWRIRKDAALTKRQIRELKQAVKGLENLIE